MQNILMATDLSAHSDRALERAIKLARHFKARLHVLHVAGSLLYPKECKGLPHPALELEKILDAQLKHYKIDASDSVTVQVVEGDAVVEILSAAQKIKADLIVMGMHNKSKKKLRDMFIGTTIERVTRKGTWPVLMVKDKALTDYKKVLIGTDFGFCSHKALRLSAHIAPKAAFHLVHVFRIPFSAFIDDQHARNETKQSIEKSLDDYLETEKQYFKKHSMDFPANLTVKILDDVAYAGLMAEAQNTQSDLIALGAHGKSEPAPSFFGSTSIDIMVNPPCDVLICRELDVPKP